MRKDNTMLTRYSIKNLDCTNCALKIEKHLRSKAGLESAVVNFAASELSVETDDITLVRDEAAKVEPGIIIDYCTSRKTADSLNIIELSRGHIRDISFIVMSIILLAVLLASESDLHEMHLSVLEYGIALTAFLLCGYKVLISAVKTVLRKQWFDENVLMSIASIGAFAIHALEEAIGVMIFYQIGELLQNLAVRKSRNSIRKLMEIRPDFANIKTAAGLHRVSPSEVNVNDIITVKPGEKIPLDSEVIEGRSAVDTSVLTGESAPLEKTAGDIVLAGEINLSGVITLRVMKCFEESSVAKILRMVEQASEKKAKTENFITSFAKYYTPAIVGLALLVAVIPPLLINGEAFTTWIYRALVLLVISCPCALIISIPLGYFGGIGGASRRGILIKGSMYIDVLANVKHVIFDKTGTLTKGSFAIKKIVSLCGLSEQELLKIAAVVESHSNHPVAKSVVRMYKEHYGSLENAVITQYSEIPGAGITAYVDNKKIAAGNEFLMKKESVTFDAVDVKETVLYLSIDDKIAGYMIIGDEIKDDAEVCIKRIRDAGINDITMLTGDNRYTAASVAEKLSIQTFYAELLPENKVELLEEVCKRKKQKGTVAFVGDGINDAPVLARADVGIAMGALGTDAAIESADVVLMTDHPSKVAEAIMIGRKTRSIIIQNIIIALGIKIVVLLSGMAGFVSMWGAVFADVGVALIAVMNSTRALHFKYMEITSDRKS